VQARTKATGKEQKIRIEASSGLTDANQKMKQEQVILKRIRAKEKVEKINRLDSLIFQTEAAQRIERSFSEANRLLFLARRKKELKEAHKRPGFDSHREWDDALMRPGRQASQRCMPHLGTAQLAPT